MLGIGSQNYLIKVIFGLENKQFLSKLQATGSKMKSIGTSMTRNLTLPIVGAGIAIVKFSADFEKQMNFVQAVTNATGEDFEKLRKQALLLGRDTAFSASQSAEAQKFLGMAGFETNTILGAMPAVLDLAAAGQMDLAKAADIVTNVMTGMGVEVSQVRGAVDVLTNTFVQSNTNLSQLGEAFSYVATTASELGMSIEQTAAGIGLLGNAGIQGSRAGTVLRNVMIRLAKINTQVARGIDTNVTKAFKNLNIEIETSEGTMRSFTDLMTDFRASTKDMTAVKRKGLFSEIFGIRGGEATALLKATDEEFKAFVKSLEDSAGTAERIAKKQMEGFHGRMTMLKASLELLAISLGDSGILEFFTELVQNKLIPFINSLSEMDPLILSNTLKIAGFVAAIGPLIFILGSLITHFGTIIALIGGPATGLIILFGAVATAGYTMWERWKRAGDKFKGEVVKNLREVVIESIKTEAALAKLGEEAFLRGKQLAVMEVSQKREQVKKDIELAKKWRFGMTREYKHAFDRIQGLIKEAGLSEEFAANQELAYTLLFESFEGGLRKANKELTEAEEALANAKDEGIDFEKTIGDLEESTEDLGDKIKEVTEEFVSWFQVINKMFSDETADKILGFFDKITEAINDAKQAAKEAQAEFKKWQQVFSGPAFPQMTEQVDAMRKYAIEYFKETGKPFAGDILGKYGVPIGGGTDFGEPKKDDDVDKKVKTVYEKLNDVFLESIQQLTQSIQTGDIAGAFQHMFNALGSVISEQVNKMIVQANLGGKSGTAVTFGGQLLGALGGGLVGVGIGLLGGLFGGGKKGRGDNPETPVFAYITNWKDFYQAGASMTSSFIFSGRAQGGYTDPHGRSLAFDIRDQQTGAHYST